MNEYGLLDTQAFKTFLSQKAEILQRYKTLNDKYDDTIDRLLDNWEGQGATAFDNDSTRVRANIHGIYEALKMVFDMLEDCLIIFENQDAQLGEHNRE